MPTAADFILEMRIAQMRRAGQGDEGGGFLWPREASSLVE